MEDIPESVTTTLSKLPVELQSVIRRKCSRDPKTRFTYKIHLLLAFILTNSYLEEEVGIGWVSEQEFRINKKRLVELLGIKMNSMNVNLHDLGFHKMQHEKNGWTRWTRDGFTQNRILMDTDLESVQADIPRTKKVATIEVPTSLLNEPEGKLEHEKPEIGDKITDQITSENNESTSHQIHFDQNLESDKNEDEIPTTILKDDLGHSYILGTVMRTACNIFVQTCITLWFQMFNNLPIYEKVPKNVFIKQLALAAKRPEQPIQNSIEVIEAIFADRDNDMNSINNLDNNNNNNNNNSVNNDNDTDSGINHDKNNDVSNDNDKKEYENNDKTKKKDDFTFIDLLTFLARFGPIETSMIKIAHMAKCTILNSNTMSGYGNNFRNNWIFFYPPQTSDVTSLSMYGYFDSNELNMFVINMQETGTVKKVWNMPLIDAYGCYLADEKVKTFCSWLSFFEDIQK
ncbi:hypothetical protein TRFO_34114 [Tritrichomonas foetus]|uniref:Initiator binding domain-containing protein n=1 Tax=Tritrichomonas foetus TaxID=1144522 RepID=A0A1J4JLV4_9EUKA|nr:hypothetical protein TRFO_34114 [Tritrichomonas foetus]|eukprot:OHS99399.1 hypothetical protein TRFO_34114 [Tritrichomonas foetus]